MPRKMDFVEEVERRISARVEEARIMAGWSNKELGSKLGVTHQQAGKYCNGSNRITAGKLYFIAKELKLPMSYFFDDSIDDSKALYFKDFAKLTIKQQVLISKIAKNLNEE
jgi:transcriptional regulator with XRE-family HTH domain